ncbi:hypothetical protein B0H19DRAFT_1377230 [Mycena capillaripes]|nr:hypothetical protein B0H19DRAFT_1377230 [Mycena capillaripes]
MCFGLFGRRSSKYNPDLEVLFPLREMCGSLDDYRRVFLASIRDAPKIAESSIQSVAYCRTRGATGYPFLTVHLEYPTQCQYPIRLKLQGFDDAATVQAAGRDCRYWEQSTFSVAGVHQPMAKLVGTRRYDVLHTMTFRSRVNTDGRIEPSIVDLLVLAKLSTNYDHTREGYPANLFAALKTLFNGYITSAAKADAPPSRVTEEIKSAVLDAFLIKQRLMHDDIDFRSGRGYVEPAWITELRTRNAALKAQATLLKELIRLEAGGNSFTPNTSDTLAP